MDKKSLSFLLLIIVLAVVVRFSYLTYNPPSLNWDEISHGYNAYSILKTGMDQWGERFPIFNFRAYGDYPTTLNLYLTIPFIAIFGLTEFAIRAPHALLGVLTVVSIYFLTWGLTKKRSVSLLAAGLAAFGPWYVFTSRFVLQSNLSVFLLSTAGALFFNREKHKYFLPLSLIVLTLTLFSYHSTRIFSPLLLLTGLIFYGRSKAIIIFAFLFFVLTGFILQRPESRVRSDTLFLVDQGAVNRIIEARAASPFPQFVSRFLYNRPAYFITKFSKNYISYFSPKFLFFEGGTQYQFSVPGKGLIYPVSLPFFYIGLILLVIKSFKDKNFRLLLVWLLLAPIPASITSESYTVLRATAMLPIPEILISIGFFAVVGKLNKNFASVLIGLYFILFYFFAEHYFLQYFTSYRTNYSSSWQQGYKEVVNYVNDNYLKYDKIIVTKKYGEPHEYFLFFLGYDPARYLSDRNAIRFFQSGWYWVDKFDKFYFVNDWQVKEMKLESGGGIDCAELSCLLITSPSNFPGGWQKLKEINFLDGKPAFEIYENK